MTHETKKYSTQYNLTYQKRLDFFKEKLSATCLRKWGSSPISCLTLLNTLEKESNVIIQGMLIIASDLKPSIFDEIHNKPKKTGTYFSENLAYFLEDKTGRIELDGQSFKDRKVATGMIIGVKGRLADLFVVEDIVLPCEYDEIDKNDNGLFFSTRKIVLVSGVDIKEESYNFEKLKIILNYLSPTPQLVLIGPVCGDVALIPNLRYFSTNFKDTIVVPGLGDLTSQIVPLKPLNKRIFYPDTITLFPNPVQMNGVVITAGENIEDLLKYWPVKSVVQEKGGDYRMHIVDETPLTSVSNKVDDVESYLEGMETIIKSGYLCPTSPDTLKCEPLDDDDPFCIKEQINLFICGNAPEFGIRIKNERVYLCVPNFNMSGTVIIYDLDKREAELVKID